MWMPQLDNDKIMGCILRSIISVISRRTSEAYATTMVKKTLKELTKKHSFLCYVEIQDTQYTEFFDVVNIQPEINHIEAGEIGKAGKEFIEKITWSMGKNAGYYFLREVKEDLPYDYEQTLKELDIDLDLLQLEFITSIKRLFKFRINNYEILKYILTIVFEAMDREFGRDTSYSTISELVERLNTEYPLLKYIKINDIRYIQGVDFITIAPDVNKVEPTEVGAAIQRIIQEINNYYGEQKDGFLIIEKLKNYIKADYIFKLEELGVNLDVIQLRKELVIKHVLKAVINVLSQSGTQSYAMLMMNIILRKFEKNFKFLKLIQIDSTRYSEGGDEISISSDIESVGASEIGRGIQKIIEDIVSSLGDKAGLHFIDKFKKRLGKAYVLRIEEMGVNLHMIELSQNLI
jgi:hypothetical protein